MTNSERLVVIEIATKLVQGGFSEERRNLKRSSEIMLFQYENDKELVALTELDGEDFPDV